MAVPDKNEDMSANMSVGTDTTIIMESEEATAASSNTSKNPTFCRGDHVYQWCSFAGIPCVFQHHGIVMHVEMLQDGTTEQLTIADFSNFLPDHHPNSSKQKKNDEQVKTKRKFSWKQTTQQSSASLLAGGGTSTGGVLRVYTTTTTTTCSSKSWHKVEYNAPRWKTVLQRSGVSTTVAASDPPEVVLNRVNFLIMQSERKDQTNTFQSNVLPKYHLLFSNCECVAMWCKTGRWSTLQGASLLTGAAYGTSTTTVAIGQAATAGGSAAAVVGTAVEVAAVSEGVVWSAGPTSAVLSGTTQPWIGLSALAAYGALTVGGIAGALLLARSKWNATTRRLNEALAIETANSIAIPA